MVHPLLRNRRRTRLGCLRHWDGHHYRCRTCRCRHPEKGHPPEDRSFDADDRRSHDDPYSRETPRSKNGCHDWLLYCQRMRAVCLSVCGAGKPLLRQRSEAKQWDISQLPSAAAGEDSVPTAELGGKDATQSLIVEPRSSRRFHADF